MIEKARSIAPELDFREGNAMALPFADGSFDLVLCQEMLQFVPDRLAALREVRRVLSPGGRFLASTWRPRSEQPFHDALGRVAERHLGKSNDERLSLDGAALGHALTEAGFTDVRVETVSLTERFREFSTRMNAMAAGFDLSALSEPKKIADSPRSRPTAPKSSPASPSTAASARRRLPTSPPRSPPR